MTCSMSTIGRLGQAIHVEVRRSDSVQEEQIGRVIEVGRPGKDAYDKIEIEWDFLEPGKRQTDHGVERVSKTNPPWGYQRNPMTHTYHLATKCHKRPKNA